MNFSAEETDEEDATAVMTCLRSDTLRVAGSIRISLAKVRTIPPVAARKIQVRIPVKSQESVYLPIMPQRTVFGVAIVGRVDSDFQHSRLLSNVCKYQSSTNT